MELSTIFQNLGIALGLGLLVGMQRESAATSLAGIRTFPLLTLLGTLCALLSVSYGGWLVGAGLLALALLIVIGKYNEEKRHAGLTTEIAMLLMYSVGAYLPHGQRTIAIAIGVGIAVLLHFKGELHEIVSRLGVNDIKAIMQFALISFVILPVLPNRTFGPYNVINPRNVWLMVVLIVGISLGGYIIYKFFGQGAGIVLGGILGGLVSSTATTISYARRTKTAPQGAGLAAIIVMIASAVVFARLMLEVAVVAPGFLAVAAWPLGIMLAAMVCLAAWMWWRNQHDQETMPQMENPTELKSAIVFALLYAGILLAVAAVKDRFGSSGLYTVAAISGLTDVDAITLSTSQLVGTDRLPISVGWRVILVAALSNLAFKFGAVFSLGHRQMMLKLATAYGIALLIGIALLLTWPH